MKNDKMKILEFKATPRFGKWKKYYPEESVAHPAKINQNLLEYLVLNYTKEGDTVSDCMCGTGSTVVLSMLNSRNGIGVDLEEKFTAWAKQAISNVEREQTLTPKGKGIAICGDSRKLSELLKEHKEEINHVLFSPPYAQSTSPFVRGAPLKEGDDLPTIGCLNIQDGYSESMQNIGNLSFDAPIFSPHYSLGHDSGDNASENYKKRLEEQRRHTRVYLGGNIAKLPFIAAILFSPPYFSTKAFQDVDFMLNSAGDASTRIEEGIIKGHGFTAEARRRTFKKHKQGEIENVENISNINDFGIDAVLTSPPYDEGLGHSRGRAVELQKDKKLYLHGAGSYSNSKSNIGELKKETYLEAMETVYAECHKVLKSDGLMILILKNFIRNKKVVPLTEHTIKVCESVGFKLKERLLFKLPTQSFWRRLYSQKYPEVDTSDLQHEHILIFEKGQKS